jgi:hypothetical protein
MVAHMYNPSNWEIEEGGPRFRASLGYISSPVSNKDKKEDTFKGMC